MIVTLDQNHAEGARGKKIHPDTHTGALLLKYHFINNNMNLPFLVDYELYYLDGL